MITDPPDLSRKQEEYTVTFAQKLDKAIGYIFHGFEWAVRILLVAMTILIVLQVMLRNVFHYSIRWGDEVALDMFIYITFFTLAVALRGDQHLRVELFVSWLPEKGRKCLELIDNLILLTLSVMMVYTGFILVQYGFNSKMASTGWPTAIIYLPTPLAGLMCCIQQIMRIFGIAKSEVADRYIKGVFKE